MMKHHVSNDSYIGLVGFIGSICFTIFGEKYRNIIIIGNLVGQTN
jgi:hypothetical protein